jgi:hypothetical protein
MYPDPTTALPLPPRPDLEQYRKRAKDLVKACHSHEADGIRHWAVEWLDTLAHLTGDSDTERRREQVRRYAGEVADFARARLSGGPRQCGLSDAQFVLARAHGFASWPVMVKHFDGLARASSPVSAFEAAVDAIVGGDQATLAYLLREHPELIRARSTREHQATLLHYVSANGVEGYRQRPLPMPSRSRACSSTAAPRSMRRLTSMAVAARRWDWWRRASIQRRPASSVS